MRLNSIVERKLHKNEKGAAMIVVVCVLMVTMIICLTIIVGAYQTVATTNNGGRDVAYYQQALSFSELLKKKLTGNASFTVIINNKYKERLFNWDIKCKNYNRVCKLL